MRIFVSHASECPTDHLPHGDGLLAWEFIRRLAARGHRVDVAVVHSQLSGPPPQNVVLHPVNLRSPFEILRPLEYAVKVRQLFNVLGMAERFDVIHQLNPVSCGLSFALARVSAPLILGPFVSSWPTDACEVTPRSRGPKRLAQFIAERVIAASDRFQLRRASVLLVSTPAALKGVTMRGGDERRAEILPYGVDVDLFKPNVVEETVDGRSILFLANLYRRKGIHTLLDAFVTIRQQLPSCRLIIAGAGPEYASVQRRASEMLGVSVVGGVPRSAVPELMRRCDVYCLPSNGEPFGATVLEAMACAKPVVSTNSGGVAYLVDGRGGRTVPFGSAGVLADALLEILGAPVLAKAMGRHNRERVLREYDWGVVITKLEQIYARVSMQDASDKVQQRNGT